ncbi:helix-turn-helix transcriptional regulator [Dactylosporangium maewongense]|uniref:Helix-turn-helix transcriptional regulator n=2 Tax=Dactylosporangium maewongense TaxID=634393 RepID=A0ABN2CTQ7_9ACTN
MTAEPLARAVGFPRQQLSALENGHLGPDIDLVSAICEYLTVGIKRRTAIMDAAADGWARGWWDADTQRMGVRQALYADLESGTTTIAEYALALVPGLLQTAGFADARLRSDPTRYPETFDPAAAVAARAHRQELLLASGGPRYEVVLDEFAIRRCAAEPGVVADQLRHIVAVCAARATVTVQVLPMNAPIKGHSAPRSAYSIYRYGVEPGVAVAVDTLTKDLVLTEPDEIDPYLSLHRRLKAAALASEASLRLLHAAAQELSPIEGAAA